MSDTQVSTVGAAVAVIDVNQDASIVAWCARFDVAEDVLRAAVCHGRANACRGRFLCAGETYQSENRHGRNQA
jgi:hypothetical protein